MGKATKRERQKTNKMVKDLARQKAENRQKRIKGFTILGIILILPLVVIVSVLVNSATTPANYTAKISVSIEDKEIGTIEVKLDEPNAPKSVKRFIELSSNGVYNNIEFFAASKNQGISAGALNPDGTGSYASVEQVEGPPRDYAPGDLIWGQDPIGTLQVGTSFSFLTATKDSSLFKKGGINTKTEASSEQKASYQLGYIGFITKGLDIARKIEALAPTQELDPKTGKPMVDDEGKAISPATTPTKSAKIIRITIYKDGKEIKVGDYKNIVTSSTTTTTIAPVVSDTPST